MAITQQTESSTTASPSMHSLLSMSRLQPSVMRRAPSAPHLRLSASSSLPVLTRGQARVASHAALPRYEAPGPWALSCWPPAAYRQLPLARPLVSQPTPSMQHELAGLVFKPLPRLVATAPTPSDTARLARKAKCVPGPKVLRISGIHCDDLPDADKGMGAGTSDPYLTFLLVTDRGESSFARTRTIMNAPRDVTFPDVLELPVPMSLLKGFSKGTLIVRVWDDDSREDGEEGINADDLMGQNAYRLNCFLTRYRIEGNVDRATYAGVGSLYAFRVSFKYETFDPAVPVQPATAARDGRGARARPHTRA